MFNISTAAKILSVFLGIFLLGLSAAQNSYAQAQQFPVAVDPCRQKVEAEYKNKPTDDQFFEKMARCTGQPLESPACADARKDFNEAKTDFKKRCNEANMSANGKGFICSHQVQQCEDVASKVAEVEDDSDIDAQAELARILGSVSGQGVKSFESGSDSDNPDLFKKFVNQCPAYAGVDLKVRRDRLKDLKKRVPELQEELTDLDEKFKEDNNATQVEIQKLKREAELEVEQAEEDIEELKNDLEDMNQALAKSITENHRTISELESQLREVDFKVSEERNALVDALAEIEDTCYDVAAKEEGKRREAELNQISNNVYSTDGLNNLLSQTGSSRFQKSQKRISQSVRRCLIAKPTKNRKARAQRAYRAKIKRYEDLKVQIKTKIQQINSDIQRASTVEKNTKTQRIVQKMQSRKKKAEGVVSELYQQISQKEKEMSEKYMTYLQRKQTKSAELMNLTREKDHLEQVIRHARRTGASDITQNDITEAQNGWLDLADKSRVYVESCQGREKERACKDVEGVLSGDPDDNASIKSACGFPSSATSSRVKARKSSEGAR